MVNKVACILMVVLGQTSWSQSQDRGVINGKITANTSDLEGVYVINAQTEAMTTTDESGAFSISAKEGDTLVFSSIQFKENKVLLIAENFSDLHFTVKLNMVMHQLQEVVVRNYNGINAASLGIVPYGQKKYTEAERKLHTATALNPTANAGSMAGGSISADPLLNFFSGRTAMLKKEVAVEKKEAFMKLLERMFSINHFVNRLQIPLEYVKGFEYYAVENDKFTVILNSKNKTSTEFLLAELAVKYKEIIASENK
ncbi:carboxypeptidase-like protein [Flavobacterium sp. 90]|uniref:carboxypeptidase-like regulatory domain-containing protein n=1 Tax=unclassified Flavobacterium TaxID=196869 RepID=UPI000EB05492|nr:MULTISPECIES: carboxypeptidase-like regulatory domain-containing protein [unclassified Flavobacterium]RKR09374.1 carboxypeptidase-like protein [Flavobacterium sp. 81]TCK53158.1 carboxypeptidase-like protein [Flavobacterium sp. 90]